MPAIDFGSLLAAERDRRRRARAGAAIPASAEAPAPSSEPVVRLAPRADLRLGEGAHAVGASLGVSGLHFIPDFLSSAEETSLARAVYHHEARFVTCRGGRRVQNHGGSPSSALVAEPLPPFAAALRDALVDAGVYAPSQAPNHVLVNEYLRPAGIAPHSDGDVYLDKVAIVTLEGAALMDFWPDDGSAALEKGAERSDGVGSAGKDENRSSPSRSERPSNDPLPSAQVWLKPRGLLVYEKAAFRLRHGIREAEVDVVTDRTANARAEGLAVGAGVERGARRLSIVFVRKG